MSKGADGPQKDDYLTGVGSPDGLWGTDCTNYTHTSPHLFPDRGYGVTILRFPGEVDVSKGSLDVYESNVTRGRSGEGDKSERRKGGMSPTKGYLEDVCRDRQTKDPVDGILLVPIIFQKKKIIKNNCQQ